MTPQENVEINRTVGDTDPIVITLVRDTDEANEVPVPDNATVALHLRLQPVVTLEGVSAGQDNGQFTFAAGDLAEIDVLTIPFEIEVTEGPTVYTIASGLILQRAQIA